MLAMPHPFLVVRVFARGASPDIQLAAPFAIGMLGWIAWHDTGKKFWLVDFYFFMAIGIDHFVPLDEFKATASASPSSPKA